MEHLRAFILEVLLDIKFTRLMSGEKGDSWKQNFWTLYGLSFSMASSIEKGPAKLHIATNIHSNVIKIVPWSAPHYQAQREGFRMLLSELLVKWLKAFWASRDGNSVLPNSLHAAQYRASQQCNVVVHGSNILAYTGAECRLCVIGV